MPSNKSTKWIVIGSIVFVLAILVAIGPILFSKYMRAKWENGPKYKVSNILMNVSGQLCVSKDNVFYLKGNDNLYYVLENIKQDIKDKVGQNCSVIGRMRIPKNDETIDGNKVRLFIAVNKIVFNDKAIYNKTNDTRKQDIENKIAKKAKLRVEINAKLNKPIMFDVVKGKVSGIKRVDNNGKEFVAFVLVDDFNDSYMLYKKGADLSVLENKEIACLGREILPPKNIPVVVDETTFEIYEVYDANYNKLI